MYEGGQIQRKIRNLEIEGMVLGDSYDVFSAGAYLSLFGKRDGYLSDNFNLDELNNHSN
tara:strand:- start:337 stop:513 length:177 start_codon:yes stop_codon:yes gene_type:complete